MAAVRWMRPLNPPPDFPPCVAAARYAGVLRRVLLCQKDRPRRYLVHCLAPVLRIGLAAALSATLAGRAGVALVPIPTAMSARRRRGGDHLLPLLRAACGGHRGAWPPVLRVLRARERSADSVGLSATARRNNVHGAFAVRRSAACGRGHSVVLVDDVVASGATLAEAARVLRGANYHVLGAVVLAGVD
ncbi:MAG: ComF family protein [Mycobacteriales bacterium]